MRNMFAICGDSGSGKTTMAAILGNYLTNSTILECDRYHKWERGDTHWDKFTHLNTSANHISWMINDAVKLKAGNDIFCRDYDHKTGKFTEAKEIRSCENIILCGLHTFYCPEDMFILKIFMDTADDLKTQWKISRDTDKRGHSTKAVKDQILRRKEDYTKYLQPLIEQADIIVNFCNEKDTDRIDSVKGIGRRLELFIKEPYDTTTIVRKFKDIGVSTEHPISSREGYVQISIKNYKKLDKNYYYDYVMLCIQDMIAI